MSSSVQFRIRRITSEYAYVTVPISPDVLTSDNRLDTQKLTQLAIRQGQLSSARWHQEEQHVDIHPVQKPMEVESGNIEKSSTYENEKGAT